MTAARRWLVLAAVWCIPAIVTGSSIVFARPGRHPGDAAVVVFWDLMSWQLFTLTTPLITALARRFRVDGTAPPRGGAAGRGTRVRVAGVAVHLVANFAIGALHILGLIVCGMISGDIVVAPGQLVTKWGYYYLEFAHVELIAYWAVVAVAYMFDYQREARRAAVAQAELAAQLTQAQLDALSAQLRPHFLFNTLNAITVLTRKGDTATATRMLEGLSDLLRHALDSAGAQTVTLRDELAFVDRYLEIEQIRFGDRLRIHRAIDPGVLGAAVPNLLLQPLVENALRHGLEPKLGGGRLELTAARHGARLRLEVRDDGAGLEADQATERSDRDDASDRPERPERPSAGHDDRARRGEPLGLANVRARLHQLYGDAHRFRVEPAAPGVRVVVELPLEPAGSP